jgi:hypothetical protein
MLDIFLSSRYIEYKYYKEFMFPDSSVVEQVTVNHLAGGSSPSRGAKHNALIAQLARAPDL